MNKTLFISDNHLSEADPAIAERFITLFEQPPAGTDAIYILGDLFDAWIGDDNHTAFYRKITDAIKSASQRGVNVFYMHGNRDFLIGSDFLESCKATHLNDGAVVSIYNNDYLLMHGDLLCTKDEGYQRMRKIFQFKPLQKLFLSLPLSWRQNIAKKIRYTSNEYNQQTKADIMDVAQDEVEKRLTQTTAQSLIHGHTHRHQSHTFQINGKEYQRHVLPAWEDQPRAFVVQNDGKNYWLDV